MAINQNGFELPKPYYQDEWVTQHCGDALVMLPDLPDNSIDLLCTDPPYGIGFMGKDWDKALPDKRIWAECLRVLKPGAFAFVMSIPRADCLSRMIISLEDAGFRVDFTPIYWAYASGFPKAQNIGKAVDKRLGTEREVIGKHPDPRHRYPNTDITGGNYMNSTPAVRESGILTAPATPQAKALDGSYGGFQPKPAVEVIIVCMKPLSEKTFVDQALKNQKGITWLDDCRVSYESEGDKETARYGSVTPSNIYGWANTEKKNLGDRNILASNQGRFPANLLVSDDVLNDGRVSKSGKDAIRRQEGMFVDHHLGGVGNLQVYHPDSGSFSRYFDLDKWAQKTFPFLIVPKASKSEKNKGLDILKANNMRVNAPRDTEEEKFATKLKNNHPTVKPVKLMSYLITLGSRPGDTVIDPFGGSGTTAKASKLLGRYCIISEIKEKYCEIAAKRYSQLVMRLEI